ncbi:hypothetical protein MSPP1_000732 [Malassezia sp. CBS 17886]|nr:hypothetical protein MSPP1_000732 [Malassezia sp. CBS 17886]
MRVSVQGSVALALLGGVLCAAHEPEGAGKKNIIDGRNYMQDHMANEHHIGAFDLESFFALHDLDRNGVLDRSEIEAIYGVHHSASRKHSPNAEVHDGKADHIVREVLRSLDRNGDGLITRSEFVRGGTRGLPLFPEYGKNALGHHYDEESEYYVHHESVFHRKPEDQTDEAYTHDEDLKHFADHERIELDEENRERHAQGQPSLEEEEKLQAQAAKDGKPFESVYEKQFTDEEIARANQAHADDALGEAGRELASSQHVFKTPNGVRLVQATKENVIMGKGAFGEKDEPPVFATGDDTAARAPQDHVDGETELARRIRLDRARREASGRPRFGQGNSGFKNPRDDADRFKTGMPYKYRMKKKGFLHDL